MRTGCVGDLDCVSCVSDGLCVCSFVSLVVLCVFHLLRFVCIVTNLGHRYSATTLLLPILARDISVVHHVIQVAQVVGVVQVVGVTGAKGVVVEALVVSHRGSRGEAVDDASAKAGAELEHERVVGGEAAPIT